MTPKEKAKELFEKYYEYVWQKHVSTRRYKTEGMSKSAAKWCALVSVNEVIEQWEYIDTYLADGRGELNPNLKYWYEVKEEIKKL